MSMRWTARWAALAAAGFLAGCWDYTSSLPAVDMAARVTEPVFVTGTYCPIEDGEEEDGLRRSDDCAIIAWDAAKKRHFLVETDDEGQFDGTWADVAALGDGLLLTQTADAGTPEEPVFSFAVAVAAPEGFAVLSIDRDETADILAQEAGVALSGTGLYGGTSILEGEPAQIRAFMEASGRAAIIQATRGEEAEGLSPETDNAMYFVRLDQFAADADDAVIAAAAVAALRSRFEAAVAEEQAVEE